MGICPLDDIITGPIVINQSNVDNWIKNVKGIIGEEAYKKQITWSAVDWFQVLTQPGPLCQDSGKTVYC